MGAIRDVTLSFNIPFVIGGLSFIISALMHFLLMWIDHKEKRQLNKPDNNYNINKLQTNSITSDV